MLRARPLSNGSNHVKSRLPPQHIAPLADPTNAKEGLVWKVWQGSSAGIEVIYALTVSEHHNYARGTPPPTQLPMVCRVVRVLLQAVFAEHVRSACLAAWRREAEAATSSNHLIPVVMRHPQL